MEYQIENINKTKSKKRVGRGDGSGRGTYSGKGCKGQISQRYRYILSGID